MSQRKKTRYTRRPRFGFSVVWKDGAAANFFWRRKDAAIFARETLGANRPHFCQIPKYARVR